jgi:hypothetical protein
VLSQSAVRDLISKQYLPSLIAERERLTEIDNWYRWNHDDPSRPRGQPTTEYKRLSERSKAPWLGLVVTNVAQNLYVAGYRRADAPDDVSSWEAFQQNGLASRQIAVHRAALAYGYSFATVLPGATTLGAPMPVVRGVSPRNMVAFYEDPAEDDWPVHALRADVANVDGRPGWSLRLYDDTSVYYLLANGDGKEITWVESREHDIGVCPVVRFANQLDLEGRADGEVEPFIPLAARIDQTTFDRLVVQRFASWVVRTISGMSKPDDQAEAAAEKLRLRAEDILVASDPDTKFGSLPATPLDGFIKAHEADIQALAAVSQTPAHEMLGAMANLSAEALAAARASLMAKVEERKHLFGQSWGQTLRLAARVMGDTDAAGDMSAQIRWRDTEIRSLAQAADALGKLAQMLGVPVELLWEKIPGWTDQDVERAKTLAAQGGGVDQLLAELLAGTEPPVGVE